MMTTMVRGTRASARRLRHQRGPVAAFALAMSLAAGAARGDAVVVFDNFQPPNDTFATFSGQLMNNLNSPPRDYDIANAFTPSASGYVSDIWAAFTLQTGSNIVDLWLMSDNNGMPGQILEVWQAVNQMGIRGGFGGPVHFTGDQSTFVQGGQQYWLVSSSPLPTVSWWMHNAVNDFGPVMRRINGGAFSYWSDQRRGAFRVAVVPEPATLLLLAGGAVVVLRRRRSSGRCEN